MRFDGKETLSEQFSSGGVAWVRNDFKSKK